MSESGDVNITQVFPRGSAAEESDVRREEIDVTNSPGISLDATTIPKLFENSTAHGSTLNCEVRTLFKNSRRPSLDSANSIRIVPQDPLEIQCGEKTALLFVSKLCQGSKGPCILYGNEWLTPNELQYICGRETAKDWKRSIRHKGKSLKSLIAQGFLKVHPPICDCPGCRVSSPVNRSRLADKCAFSKIPFADKSMAEGFPTMWRRSSTSSDETDQTRSEHVDDDSLPQRSHSDEPQFYRSVVDHVHVAKRPRSSSPDIDRDCVNIKRRCMSETSTEVSVSQDDGVKSSSSPSSYDDRKCDVIELEMKSREPRTTTVRATLKRDLPALTLPSSAYSASVFYGQPHFNLHRQVNSPRLLSPPFVRPSVTPPAQIRLLHEQAMTSSHIYTQQLRHDFPGMATMFPYTFTHPLPGNQLLTSHCKKSDEAPGNEGLPNEKQDKEASHSPSSESSPKHNSDKSRSSSVDNFCNEEGENRRYSELIAAAQWDIDEVCKFVSSVPGCAEYTGVFREQEIDGQALILLTEEHLSNKMGLKLGPALKLKSKIDELRCVYTK